MSYQATPYRRDKIDVQVHSEDGNYWQHIFPGALGSATKGEVYRDRVRSILTPKDGNYAIYRILIGATHVATTFDMGSAIKLADEYDHSYIVFQQLPNNRKEERRASHPPF